MQVKNGNGNVKCEMASRSLIVVGLALQERGGGKWWAWESWWRDGL